MRHSLFFIAALSCPISPAPAAEAERTTRVFDLRFLLRGHEEAGVDLPEPALWSAGDGGSRSITFLADAEEKEESLDLDDVRQLIEEFIDPDSWHNKRNSIESSASRLIITQTPDVLAKIGALLSLLDARASRIIVAEMALVPPGSIERAAPGCLKPGASPWLDGAAFDAALLADPVRSAWLTAIGPEGGFIRLQPRSVSMMSSGNELNLTGVLPVANPNVDASFEGAAGRLRVLPLPQEGWLRLDLKLGRREVRGKPERRKVLQAEVDLPVAAQEEVRTTVVVPEGRTILLGFYSAGEPGGQAGGSEPPPSYAALLRVRPASTVRGGRPEGLPHIIEAASPLAPTPRFCRSLGGAEEVEYLAVSLGRSKFHRTRYPFGMDEAILFHALAEDAGLKDAERLHLVGGALFHAEPEAISSKILARMRGLARERLRLVTVDLWQGSASGAAIAGDGTGGALLELGWIDRMASRPGVRARLSALIRTQSSIASVLSRSFVADVELISGGTGDVAAVVAQPVLDAAGAGLLLNVACDLVPGSGFAQLHVHGELARPPVFGRQARARASLEVAPPKEGETSPIQATAEWVTLDLPDEDGDRWEHLVTVPLGRPVLLNALPDPASPGKTRALVAVVHEFALKD